MTFVIKPYKELVLMTKEKIEEVMVPLRIRSAGAMWWSPWD